MENISLGNQWTVYHFHPCTLDSTDYCHEGDRYTEDLSHTSALHKLPCHFYHNNTLYTGPTANSDPPGNTALNECPGTHLASVHDLYSL